MYIYVGSYTTDPTETGVVTTDTHRDRDLAVIVVTIVTNGIRGIGQVQVRGGGLYRDVHSYLCRFMWKTFEYT